LSQVVLGRSKNIVQTNLFLKHIILTFGAQLGIIWDRPNGFILREHNKGHQENSEYKFSR